MSPTERPLTIGLVGCGAISTQHVEAIAAVDGLRLGAVASASAERAERVGTRAGVPWTTSLDELLDRPDIDIVSILTPSGLHPSEAISALERGKHVLVEKPLALSVADADAVIAAAERAGRTLATVSQRRFEPVMQALHRAVDDGALGTVSLIVTEGLYMRPQSYYDSAAWRGTTELDGGVLMNQAIHVVDLVRWLGGPVRSVAGQVTTRTHAMEAEDTATVSLAFESGALGAIVATTSAVAESPAELRVVGDAGRAWVVGEAAAVWEVPGVKRPEADRPERRSANGATPRAATWGTTAIGHVRQYTDLRDAIRSGRPPAVTGADGRNAVEIVTAAYEASRTNRSVELGAVAR
jgi:UDP-N-acetyl-2-amino-2-deoxyglucuronate dehydrogenase